MQRTEIEIREIHNGWLLSIKTENMKDDVNDMYFQSFPDVLAYLHKLNFK